ncbi:MAG: SpoIIE family protein phosphatase [Planctomycetota bacterium]|nr:SpoIIE family protein phosphatase [Planctomycetota bacterium]
MPCSTVPELKLFLSDSNVDEAVTSAPPISGNRIPFPRKIPACTSDDLSRQTHDCVVQVLTSGLGVLKANFAAIYLLDSETQYLVPGPSCGEQADMPGTGVRMLQQTTADLEALTGHVVTLETSQRLACWNAPLSAEAGICVPLVWNDSPLGTLWFFFDAPQKFQHQHVALVELVALRIADYLTGSLLRAIHPMEEELLKSASIWQKSRQQEPTRDTPAWDIRGWSNSQTPLHRTFYDWQNTDNGLCISLAQAQGLNVEAALLAAVVEDQLRSLQQELQTPCEILESVNTTIWNRPSGDQFTDVLQLVMDSSTGQVTYSQAGEMQLFSISENGIEISPSSAPEIGIMDYGEYENACHRMQAGDCLIAMTELASEAIGGTNRDEKRTILRRTMGRTDSLSADEILDRLKNRIMDGGLEDRDAAVVVVKYAGESRK